MSYPNSIDPDTRRANASIFLDRALEGIPKLPRGAGRIFGDYKRDGDLPGVALTLNMFGGRESSLRLLSWGFVKTRYDQASIDEFVDSEVLKRADSMNISIDPKYRSDLIDRISRNRKRLYQAPFSEEGMFREIRESIESDREGMEKAVAQYPGGVGGKPRSIRKRVKRTNDATTQEPKEKRVGAPNPTPREKPPESTPLDIALMEFGSPDRMARTMSENPINAKKMRARLDELGLEFLERTPSKTDPSSAETRYVLRKKVTN